MAAPIAPPQKSDDDPTVAVARPAPFVAPATATPGLPPFRRPPKKKGMPLLPVIIGVAGALLLGGGGVVLLFMRSSDGSASDPVSVASAAPSTTSADFEDEEPDATGKSQPPTGSSGKSGDDKNGDSSVAEVEMTITCQPKCEQLFVDNREIPKPFNAFRIAPGRHVVKAIKTGYLTVVDTVDVQPGKAFVKEYALVKIDGTRPLPKDCGQFLKPCK